MITITLPVWLVWLAIVCFAINIVLHGFSIALRIRKVRQLIEARETMAKHKAYEDALKS